MPLFPFFSRPASKTPWASSGNVNAPSDGERAAGYADGARPGSRRFNFLLNELASGMRYLLQRGLPDWVNDDSFPQYALLRDPFDGQIYYAFGVPVDGTAPHSDAAHWKPIFPPPGALIRETILSSGTTLAAVTGCKLAMVELWAGGGAGGGVPSMPTSPAQSAVAGGGSAGGYGRFKTTTIPGTWTFAVGAGGAGSAGANGADGGDTTFSDGSTTVTAHGGPGAPAGSIIPANNGGWARGGALPALTTNATLPGSGQAGGAGTLGQPSAGGEFGASGAGGASIFGGNGQPAGYGIFSTSPFDGNDAIAPGSGGSGAITVYSTFSTIPAKRGGNGFRGQIILREYS